VRISLLLSALTVAGSAWAYDSRPGDALIELRSGLSGSALELGQMLHEHWRGSVLLTHGWAGERLPVGLGLMAGYEGHRRGYALLPRARFGLAMALLRDGGLGLVAQSDVGLLWYAVRGLGLGFSVGAQAWGDSLVPEASLSLVTRW
jgi:hypothetical protein